MVRSRTLSAFITLALALGGCVGAGKLSAGNLLHGKDPRETSGVQHVERLTDGVTPADGDPWRTNLSAVYSSAGSYAIYDLGRSMPIEAAFLQGDNNDRFVLSVSEDGTHYREIWQAPAVDGAGMRPRSESGLSARGRFLRLTARGGDQYVSAGELMVFARRPQPWPPQLEQRRGLDPEDVVKGWLVGLGAMLVLLLASTARRLPSWLLAAAALGTVVMGLACVRELVAIWPPPIGIGETLRAVIAAVAMLGLSLWSFGHTRVRRGAVEAVLAVLALLSIACFYNFGAPWFWNVAEGRATPVHTYDMRVYFPVAKYFRELHFDGVYLASVKAYLDGENLSHGAVQDVQLRDLSSNQMVRARDRVSEIDAVKRRFSPARWQALVRDMRFFWRTMGRESYLDSLRDHGGNATPVWLAIAHLLFRNATATERTLTLTALLDPLLIVVTFICILRSFGLRAMLLCAIVFGTTDFPMFGSDWAGSTLRLDWLATLGLGACALRTRRYALGGALLAHAALVRAFPAVALACTPLPLVAHFCERLWKRQRVTRSELRAEQPGLGRLLASALVTSLLLIGLSSALFGFAPAWGGWLQKISMHTEPARTNHLGLRTIAAFDPDLTSDALARAGASNPWAEWERTQLVTYEHHRPAAWALRLMFCILCLLACRNARHEQAALIGLLLIPVFSYPANYYLHYVYLLPLLAVDQSALIRPFIELVLLCMSVLSYFTLGLAIDLRFFWESVILLAGYAAVLVPLAATAVRDLRVAVANSTAAPS